MPLKLLHARYHLLVSEDTVHDLNASLLWRLHTTWGGGTGIAAAADGDDIEYIDPFEVPVTHTTACLSLLSELVT